MNPFTVYGFDLDNGFLNASVIGDLLNMPESRDTFLQFKSDKASVVLRVSRDSKVEANDVVVQPWVLEMLGLSSGMLQSPNVLKITPCEGMVCEVSLQFVAFMSLKHWDEHAFNEPFLSIPGMWNYSNWPYNISNKVVEQAAVSQLLGCALCESAIVAIQILDSVVVSNYTYCFVKYSHVACSFIIFLLCPFIAFSCWSSELGG
jgi:hypothetical protein